MTDTVSRWVDRPDLSLTAEESSDGIETRVSSRVMACGDTELFIRIGIEFRVLVQISRWHASQMHAEIEAVDLMEVKARRALKAGRV